MGVSVADSKLIENAVGWAEGGGEQLAELVHHARGIGITAPLSMQADAKIRSALAEAREGNNRRKLAKMLFLTGRIQVAQGDTKADAELLGRDLPPGTGWAFLDPLEDEYYRAQIGLEKVKRKAIGKTVESCLGISRQFHSGKNIAETHHYSRELGHKLAVTESDKEAIKTELERARRAPKARDVAEMLFLLDRLFPKEAPKEPPPVPPLKKFAG